MGKRKKKTNWSPRKRRKSKPSDPLGNPSSSDPTPLSIVDPVLLLEYTPVEAVEAIAIDGDRAVANEEATTEPDEEIAAEAVGNEWLLGDEEYGADHYVEPVNGDDCEVNDDCDLGIDEEICEDIGEQFGDNGKQTEGDEDLTDADSGDEAWNDQKIPDPLSSSDDESEDRDGTNNQVGEDEDMFLKLGKCFNTKDEFKIAVLRYSLKTRYDIKLYRSQETKIGAMCSDKEGKYKWKCYASYDKKKQKMQIKIYVNEHICVRSGYSSLLKQGTIAWLFAERLRKDPKITKQEMVAEIKREYNLVVTEDQCSKAKSQLARQRRQSHEDHFARVWDYQAEVLQSNPDSTFEIETISGPSIGSKQRFYRLYTCFKSQRESWKNTCRPIIGIDGAFLKWDIKGHLLAAVGRDGDNRIIPIAWVVVEIENDDNWDWFVRHLAVSLGLADGTDMAIISDKQKGLVKAVHNILPQAEHRQCARHIMDNWKRDSHDMELQKLFWQIARSYTQGEFAKNMEALRKYNPNSYATLLVTNPATWSRAYFRIARRICCNDILNNLCESFNKTIRQARRKPLLELLEEIRRQAMIRNAKRYIVAERLQTRFIPRAHKEIEAMIAGSQFCKRYLSRNDLHEIDHEGISYRVDMIERTCGCKKWQMTGIPCIHAACVIIGLKQKVEDYVVNYYTTATWRLTYADGIAPVQGALLWPRLNKLGVLPPGWRKGKQGRPNNYARRKGRNEKASQTKLSRIDRVMTCSNCKQDGHNKTTCKNATVESQLKRSRGRPRKEQEPRGVLFGQGQASGQPSLSQASGQASQGQGSQGQRSQRQASQGQASQGQASQGQASEGQASQGYASGWASWFT